MFPSDASRIWLGPAACALGAASLFGCADARGRFEDFQTRLEHADSGVESADGGSGPCLPPEPGTVSGPALLALDTTFSAAHPILFLGTIDTPALEGTTAVHVVYRALDSLDRTTPAGPELEVGPFALHGGKLDALIPESTLDGDANPILHGAPITSEMTLSGHICGLRPFYCGTLQGRASGLIKGPFTGHFAITLLDSPGAVPERPRFGCGPDDVAEPLAKSGPAQK